MRPQRAAICALKDGFADNFASVEEMRDEYERRGKFLADSLNSLGLKCYSPGGAFYLFVSVRSTGMDGEEFANKLLSEKKVAVVPGGAFGKAGKYFVRCSYATGMRALNEAVDRISEFVRNHRKK